MKNIVINKEALKKSLAKSVADKAVVRAYLRGEITKDVLTSKGIKLASAL